MTGISGNKLLYLVLLLTLVASGCSSFNLSDGLKWPNSEDKPQIPARVVDVWTDDILHQTGQPSKRGFGGRLIFYNRENEKPIKVDGTLVVYLFDDRCEDPLREDPIHKYIFPAEILEKHHSESELGHSYSFWLPVDEVGGVERKLTIIPRFEPRVGGKVMAKPSTHVLPGRPADDQPSSPLVQRFEARHYKKRADGEVQQVAHIEPISGNPSIGPLKEEGITTTTINLPPAFTRQIINAPAQSAFGVPLATSGTQATGLTPANQASFNSGPTGVPSAAPVQAVQPGQATTGAPPPASSIPMTLPPVHSQLSRFPARRGALARPVASRARMQPLRARWPSAQPSTPRMAWSNESPTTPIAAEPPSSQWPEQEEW